MTDFLEKLQVFLADPDTWWGPGSIPTRLWEHLWVSAASVVIAGALVLPLASILAHRRRGTIVASTVVNIGRAIPSFGLLVIGVVALIDVLGLGNVLPIPALVALAAPPMFTNAVAGIETVPPGVVEAARGIGYTERQVLTAVELPLAAPVIAEGIRISFVQVIATAPLAALVAGGGLGRYIVDGFAQRDQGELFVGALLVALLAIAAEWTMTRLQRRLAPGR
jgi:osmoprotectant transport system permease protein